MHRGNYTKRDPISRVPNREESNVRVTSASNKSFLYRDCIAHRVLAAPITIPSISVAELDLDYLERRGGNTIIYEGAEGSSKEEDSPADTLDRVKVVFLGAPGVGKTSIIRVK